MLVPNFSTLFIILADESDKYCVIESPSMYYNWCPPCSHTCMCAAMANSNGLQPPFRWSHTVPSRPADRQGSASPCTHACMQLVPRSIAHACTHCMGCPNCACDHHVTWTNLELCFDSPACSRDGREQGSMTDHFLMREFLQVLVFVAHSSYKDKHASSAEL